MNIIRIFLGALLCINQVFFAMNFCWKHYEKLCPRRLDWHATRLSQKLLCNYGTTTIWKYDELIIKMPRQNIS